MAEVTRRIGLSLGADICWPICFEAIIRQLDLAIPMDGDTIRFEVSRVTIEPFDLRQPCQVDVLLDRLTHWYHTSREWIKKSVIMDDLYVFNNPWSLQSMEKQTTYCAMMKLGMPVPDTWMVPPKEYETSPDLQRTLEQYASMFDLGEVGKKLGYPMFMKPYDGGAWRGVSRIDSEEALRAAYEQSGKMVMHLQRAVEGFDSFIRCIGVGPQVRYVDYDPEAPLHDRYRMTRDLLTEAEQRTLRNMTLTINSFFGWDFNSCEALRCDGVFHPIDFANACPDSQVTSLHYHFPWLILAKVRWALFCAATDRRFRVNLDWAPFFEIAATDRTAEEKLEEYGRIAEERLDTRRFEEFCTTHLGHLEEVANEFFASDAARDAIAKKVRVLFPEHEVDQFTNLFFDRIQDWRRHELGA